MLTINKLLYFICLSGCLFLGPAQINASVSDYVDPMIGTGKTHFISMWRSESALYPGAVAPHGLVQISPETSARSDYLQGYYAWGDTIRRFSLAEHFSGWPNGSAGKGLMMPFTVSPEDLDQLKLDDLSSSFSKKDETAQAGAFSVFLQDSRIHCEFAALTRSIMGKFEFRGNGVKGVYVSGARSIKAVSDTVIKMTLAAGRSEFWNRDQRLYLVLQFRTPFRLKKHNRGYLFLFDDDSVMFKYAGSYTKPENAALNLVNEMPHWNLNQIQKQSKILWDDELSRIKVEGRQADKIMFYTALYHASLLPLNATDVNGEFPGYEHNEPLRPGEIHYRYFTPWDAFRTLHPLINLINPAKGLDFCRSMLRFYRTNGQLPEPDVMTGAHISVLFADALAKGIDDFDVPLAFEGLKEMILDPPYFRPDMAWYDSLGYIPYPQRYATTATLEFSFNDWALAQVADAAGDVQVRDQLIRRSFNYRNVYHPRERFMLTRHTDGSWTRAPLYAEADKWNMSWFVPHNTRDLINLMGGDAAFCRHLEMNFQNGHFVLDNECPMNFPFLFSYAGQPWNTMKWKNRVLRSHFNTSAGGVPGNDDWGSMSAWYIWGALGFFPACPGTDELIISAPVFDKVVIHQSVDDSLVIYADQVSKDNIYVQKCVLGDTELNRAFVHQSELLQQGRIRFKMADQPDQTWGGTDAGLPCSVSDGRPDIKVMSFYSNSDTVNSNESFTVTADLKNNGALGSFELGVRDQYKSLHSEWILLQSGESRSVKIPLKLFRGGGHTLLLGKKFISVHVKPQKLDDQSAFVYSLDVPVFHTGDSIAFNCQVQNVSGFEKQLVPQIMINDQSVFTFDHQTVKPGEILMLKSKIAFSDKPGLYALRVNNSQCENFKIINKPMQSLVLHYTFDDDSGRVFDHSGFENHGEIIGDVAYTDGVSGRGVRFIDGYIRVPDSESLDITGNEISMLCWYKAGDERQKGSFISKGAHNMLKLNNKWQVKLAVGGWGRGQSFYNAPPKSDGSGEPLWKNEWTHFAGIGTDRAIQIFYNGELKHQLSHEGPIGHTDFEWRIGSNSEIPNGRTPDGVLDEVMIFARALSPYDIQYLVESLRK